jgi:WD40 repeat protein
MEPDDVEHAQSQVGPPPAIADYQLLRLIGRGGYGTVWLARTALGEYRAVKVVYRKSFSDQKPFERELAGIRAFEPISRSHEGFVAVLHVGIDRQGEYFFYVMELGDDGKSGQVINPDTYSPNTLRRQIKERGRLGAMECLDLALALSEALAELHRDGLVHRDIKPSNIIFVNGVPKLADIGLVAGIKEDCSFVGTEGFIPPEGPGKPQADVYGLGKVLYEASTGLDRRESPALPDQFKAFLDREEFFKLNEVIFRACEEDVRLRYASASALHTDLARVARGKSVRYRRLLSRWFLRLKRVGGLSVLGLAVLSAVAYIVYEQRHSHADAERRAVGASVASGIQAMEAGDFLGALPHLTEALRLAQVDPQRSRTQRLRLGSVLDQCPKLTELWSGRDAVSDGQFSPDGTEVLLARFCGDVEIYDRKSGRPRGRPLKPPPTLINAAYSPDGRLLVTVSQSSVACIWDAAKFWEIRRVPHQSQLCGARFSPDGLRLVTAASDGVARVWAVKTGLLAMALKQHTDSVQFADFSHDGKYIVTASHDGSAQLWNAENGNPIGAPLQHGAWVTYAAFSPDDRKLVTASLDRKARVWETATGRSLPPDLVHRDGVQSAEFSPDGRYILTASREGGARLWLAEKQQPLTANSVVREGGRLTRASFSPDGHCILTTSADGVARVWDLAGSAPMPVAAPQAFSADGTRYLTVGTNSAQVWDAASGSAVCPPLIPKHRLHKAELGRDGRFLLTLSVLEPEGTNSFVQIWDVAAGHPVGPGLYVSNSPVGVALAEHGERLVVFYGNRVQTFNALTGLPLSPLVSVREVISQSFFSHDASRVATISGQEVRVWDARSGRTLFEPLKHSQPVQVAQFSPDDRYLAVGCSDNLVTASYAQVYHAANGHMTGPRLNHRAGVLSVAFSPDSCRIVTASADFTAVVWDCSTGRPVTPPFKHENQVRSAVFSPDGRWIVTASADKTARLWEAQSGEPLTPPLRSLTPLARAQFVADKTCVVTLDDRGSAQVWMLSLEQRPLATLRSLVRLLCSDTTSPSGGAPGSLEAVWQGLTRQYPADFVTAPQEIAAWHEFEAQESELQGQWFAAVLHLEKVLSLRPADAAIIQRLARAKEHLRDGR